LRGISAHISRQCKSGAEKKNGEWKKVSPAFSKAVRFQRAAAFGRARHDLQRRLNATRDYPDGGDTKKLRGCAEEHANRLPDISARRYSKNPMADTILRYYANGPETGPELRVNLPEELPAAEPGGCVILGKPLKNALKACEDAGRDMRVRGIMVVERQRLIIIA